MSTAAAAASSMLPSNQRPIPLRGRDDLVVEVIEYQGVSYRVVKDPVALKYHRLQHEQYRVLELLDTKRSLEDIRDDLHKDFPTLRLTLSDVQNLITDLHKKGLVYSERRGQGPALLKKKKEEKKKKLLGVFKNLLYLRLPGWDPEKTLQWMYPFLKWIYRPWAVWAAVLFVVSSWLVLLVNFEVFRSKLPEFQQFFGWPNLMYLWATMGIAKIIHEFGHGLSCKHYGGECHEMGVMLLVFSPCLYCDVSDSWMLKSKWQRIIIAAAGMYIEVILSAVAIYVWWNTQPGLLHHLALNIFFVTTVTTVIFNANPLMRFDGYYMMSDFLEIPNLRPKADKLLRESFAWYCLGIESKPDPFMPETGKVWFVMFAIAAWLYRWVILFGITLFLYTMLKPYDLQSIGIALATVSIGGIFVSMFVNMYKIISAPRIEPMSKPKIAVSLAIVGIVVAVILAIPITWHLESPFVLEPQDVKHIYNKAPGELTWTVEAGQSVKSGDPIARMYNEQLFDEKRELESQLAIAAVEIEKYQAIQAYTGKAGAGLAVAESVKKRDSVLNKLQQLEERLKDLTIYSPSDGIVIAPPPRPAPKLDAVLAQLSQWYGTPLNPRNQRRIKDDKVAQHGCFLEPRTHICSIAPNERFNAILVVDQGHRNDLREGMDVDLKLEHLPDLTLESQVQEISKRQLDFAPPGLTNKAGGELATVTDEQGRERLTSKAYQATVPLNEQLDLLKPGLRGRARFYVDQRSVGDWLWRYIRTTFHFRL